MKIDYDFKYYNFSLLILIVLMNVCGILIVRSAANMDEAIVSRQIIGSLAGVCACIIVSFIDYRKLLKYVNLIYLVCVIMLAAVKLAGVVRGGAGRWIVLPVLGQVQPAEFVKIGIILFFAAFFDRHKEEVSSPRILLRAIILFSVPAALILIEPNLSTTIIISVIFAVIVFCAGLNLRWVLGFAAAAAVMFGALLYTFTTELYQHIPFLEEYQKNRILGFLYPDQYASISLQQSRSVLAIGSGELLGKGLYNTDISSVKAGNFLIEEDTDFIFAIIGEELGFRGSLLILAGFLLIIILILMTASRAKDTGGKLICIGIAMWIGFQTFVNIAVATAIFPNTGVPLPFISRGVSSLLSIYIGMGIVLNVGLQKNK
ncbi:MAG: FtsW/RodA/SpoVE family cell cycle protein [Eubacteriales bacterium]|nr:FtsW/RodA/SpoVE family cell cycle protein [Eubacteriales bacterium]